MHVLVFNCSFNQNLSRWYHKQDKYRNKANLVSAKVSIISKCLISIKCTPIQYITKTSKIKYKTIKCNISTGMSAKI